MNTDIKPKSSSRKEIFSSTDESESESESESEYESSFESESGSDSSMSKSKYQPTNIKTRSTTYKNQQTKETTTTTTTISSGTTSNVQSSPVAHHQPDFRTWTREQVNQWALKLDFGKEIAKFLENNDICGKHLDTFKPKLLRAYGLKGSYAASLLTAIKKLKKTPQSAQDIFHLGLPKLNTMSLSKSLPSINTSHKPATIFVNEFPIIENLKMITNLPSLIWTTYKVTGNSLRWASENDIAQLVVAVIRDIIQSLELESRIHCQSEVTVNGLRSDMWVLICDDIPIGVVEVKKPSNVGPTEANVEMDNQHVHGQIYDYMLLLSNMHGQKNVFGIVSTYAQWRCYWLFNTFTVMTDSVSKPNITLLDIPIPSVRGTLQTKKDLMFEQMLPRTFFGTKVYNYNDLTLPPLLANVIHHMYSTGFEHIDLKKKTHFINVSEDSMIWVNFRSPIEFNFNFAPFSYITKVFLIQDLGGGEHGKVWLSCDQKGNVFVLKFFKQNHIGHDNSKDADNERKLWKEIWGIETKVSTFINNKALMMPYIKPLSQQDWDDTKIQSCINESVNNFISAGYYHLDLKKEHVGKYQSKLGKPHIVLFDLSSVKKIAEESPTEYKQKMLNALDIISQKPILPNISQLNISTIK
ncbi:hypothetical protein DLAC_06263 [Tieghemostelium lacteum]|uniref:DUF5898 domain-containing protein n=1 Tax=Tieghemostelium lacteum TaxID=361077 RepID=A0A151ZEC6_TIELA|nr:hypothetical protein DLAC_06263 [Tieghemostelium lacteum]|eukprot:KYQ92301.1 hypothetical protein DLAC_06263 [Tieghemostelium lacteum]